MNADPRLVKSIFRAALEEEGADLERLLRPLTGLEFITEKPVAEFWKNVPGE